MGRGRREDGERGPRGPITPEELEKINARRVAAGRPPMGADEEPDEEDLEVLDETEPPTPE